MPPSFLASQCLLRPVSRIGSALSRHIVARRSASTRSASDPRAVLHSTDQEDVHVVSFLDSTPTDARSPTVLGILRGSELIPDRFVPNPNFVSLVHEILRNRVGSSQLLKTMAVARQSDGFIHISDERHSPDANRTAEPDDIIASVYVEGGEVKAETYDPNAAYRVLSRDGLIQLNDELHQSLMAGLEVVRDVEAEMLEEQQSAEKA